MIAVIFSVVLYCTLLAMAETVKERKNLESVMRSDPELSEILGQLLEQGSEDLVQVIHTSVRQCTPIEFTALCLQVSLVHVTLVSSLTLFEIG